MPNLFVFQFTIPESSTHFVCIIAAEDEQTARQNFDLRLKALQWRTATLDIEEINPDDLIGGYMPIFS